MIIIIRAIAMGGVAVLLWQAMEVKNDSALACGLACQAPPDQIPLAPHVNSA
jgi:hypothetical protein